MNAFLTTPLEALRAPGRYSIVGGPFGSKLVSNDYVETGVPVIRGVNLPGNSRFSYDGLAFVTETKVARDLFGNLAFPGDIVVTQRGTLGQVGLIPQDSPFPRFVVSQSQMKLSVNPSLADPLFVYYALTSPMGQHEIRSRAITAGVPHINLSLSSNFGCHSHRFRHNERSQPFFPRTTTSSRTTPGGSSSWRRWRRESTANGLSTSGIPGTRVCHL